jgi:hypothetical protein
MHGIYSDIPKAHHICTMYTFAAILLLQFVPHIMKFPMINLLSLYISSHNILAVPSMGVFCRSLMSYFPSTFLRHCLYDFNTVPVATVVIGIAFVFYFTCTMLPV